MDLQKRGGITVDIHFYSDNYNTVVTICDNKGGERKRRPLAMLTSINNLTSDRF